MNSSLFMLIILVILLFFTLFPIILSRLIPEKWALRFLEHDAKRDIMMGSFFIFFLTFVTLIITHNTIIKGAVTISAMEYLEGYVEMPLLWILVVAVVFWTSMQWVLFEKRRALHTYCWRCGTEGCYNSCSKGSTNEDGSKDS